MNINILKQAIAKLSEAMPNKQEPWRIIHIIVAAGVIPRGYRACGDIEKPHEVYRLQGESDKEMHDRLIGLIDWPDRTCRVIFELIE